MLRARIVFDQAVVRGDTRDSLDAQPARRFEVDEKQSNLGGRGDVAKGKKHPVAVVYRESQLARGGDPNEARCATLVRDCWAPLLVGGGEEKHGGRFDEGTVVRVEFGMCHAFQAVGQLPRTVAFLEETVSFAVEIAHMSPSSCRCSRATRAGCPLPSVGRGPLSVWPAGPREVSGTTPMCRARCPRGGG